MLQRLLGHTTLMITNRYCQAVGCYDAVEAHKRYNRVNNSFWIKSYPTNRTPGDPSTCVMSRAGLELATP